MQKWQSTVESRLKGRRISPMVPLKKTQTKTKQKQIRKLIEHSSFLFLVSWREKCRSVTSECFPSQILPALRFDDLTWRFELWRTARRLLLFWHPVSYLSITCHHCAEKGMMRFFFLCVRSVFFVFFFSSVLTNWDSWDPQSGFFSSTQVYFSSTWSKNNSDNNKQINGRRHIEVGSQLGPPSSKGHSSEIFVFEKSHFPFFSNAALVTNLIGSPLLRLAFKERVHPPCDFFF